MKITGNQNFSFEPIPIPQGQSDLNKAYSYTGYISKPLRESPITGTYEFIGNRKIRRKRPDSNYTLTATGNIPSGLYETPHGISYNDIDWRTKAGKTGAFNFYMAFHGPGYYQPRMGELLTFAEVSPGLLRANQVQIDDLNKSEALKVFGLRLVPRISPKVLPFIACKGAGALSRVHEGTHDCPILLKPAFILEPLAADLSAGTYLGGIGGNLYGHNPLPSPYDRNIFVANSLYKTKFDDSGPVGPDGEKIGKCLYEPNNQDPNRPISVYDIRVMTNPNGGKSLTSRQSFFGSRNSDGSNASTCYAGADGEDSSVAAYIEDGAGNSPPHSEPANRDDQTSMPLVGIDLSYNSQSAYWHYVFKYNHYSLPFGNTSEAASMVEQSANNAFNEDHWWDYRECPENVDFLNHAFGNNITACPMNYLDVPYYASIGKFGYFGTRFQDTWRFINNEADAYWKEAFDEEDVSSDGVFYTSDQEDENNLPKKDVTFKIQLEWKDCGSSLQEPCVNDKNLPNEEFEKAHTKNFKKEFNLEMGDELGFAQEDDHFVESVQIGADAGGYDYKIGDILKLDGGDFTKQAAFKVTEMDSFVESVEVNEGGNGYQKDDILTLDGGAFTTQATFKVSEIGFFVDSVKVNEGGSGYKMGGILKLSGGAFTKQATFEVAEVDSFVKSVEVNTGGGSYKIGDVLKLGGGVFTKQATFEVTEVATFVTSVKVSVGGSGYQIDDELELSGGTSTKPAIFTVSKTEFYANDAWINNSGFGYKVGDILSLEGGTSTKKATFQVNTISSFVGVVGVAANGGGANYTLNNVVTLVGGAGIPAILRIGSVDTGGIVTSLSIVESGDYTAKTGTSSIAASGGNGTGLLVNVTYVDGRVKNLTLQNPGVYSVKPGEFGSSTTGGSGSHATVDTDFIGGRVNELVLSDGGDYSANPGSKSVGVIGGSGSGATVDPTYGEGRVSKLALGDPGAYLGKPGDFAIPTDGGAGSGAKVNLTYTDGRITKVIVDNAGSYTTKTSNVNNTVSGGFGSKATLDLTYSAGQVTKLIVEDKGGYTAKTDTSGISVSGGSGSKATVDPTYTDGRVTELMITDGGSYTTKTGASEIPTIGGTGSDAKVDPSYAERKTTVIEVNGQKIASTGAVDIDIFKSVKLHYLIKAKVVDWPVEDPEDPKSNLDTDESYSPAGAAYSAIPIDRDYDNLIKLSIIERKNYGFFISDQIIFLRLNFDIIKTSPEYTKLNTLYPEFSTRFYSVLFDQFDVNRSVPSFSDMPQPLSYAEKDSLLSTRFDYMGSEFQNLVKKYGYVKVTRLVDDLSVNPPANTMRANSVGGVIDSEWYNNLVNNKLARISNRYYTNITLGKPVDLFPEGIITFSSERANEFAHNDFLKYYSSPSAGQLKDPVDKLYMEMPSTELRYFHTAFSTQSEANLFIENKYLPKKEIYNQAGLADFKLIEQFQSFYLGYLNPRGCQKELPKGSYAFLTIINPPLTAPWDKYAPESDPPPANTSASPPRIFNEECGGLDKNFSCFSPIFLQQPINTTTKSWLPATFRVFAVDYHSIPEDKIIENARVNGIGRPEIAYWLKKIKAVDSRGNNLYPLKYKWYRILNDNVVEYLKTKEESLLEPSKLHSEGGKWYCFEGGNSPDCTVVRDELCKKIDGSAASFPCRIDGLGVFAGPNKAEADNYHYFCRVIGRFGWRDSELAKIKCESTVEMEFAYLNAAGGGGSYDITTSDGPIGTVDFSDGGFEQDDCAVFEDVEERIWNSGNDCESWRRVGPEAIGGVTRVWTPGTIVDPRGKKIKKSHWTPLGRLGKVTLDDESACFNLYAKRALPYCDVGVGATQQGVAIYCDALIHRTAADTATFTSNSRVGLIVSKITNIAELYPPPSYDKGDVFPGFSLPYSQPAHFQFENNLGLIKRYSRNPDSLSLMGVPIYQKIGGNPETLAELDDIVAARIFNVAGGSRVISGVECGYQEPSFGRFMHFYVETFSTFYSLCMTGIKPKKVKNISHIAGGLRGFHAGLQFNWLGRPKNARLKRESMPGPYGFQWKVERHNRDRSGNGMSMGFWSYFWEELIENMYDAAAVVGALKRLRHSPARLAASANIRNLRGQALASLNPLASSTNWSYFRNVTFGPDLGRKLGCGYIRLKEIPSDDVAVPPILRPTPEVYNYAYSNSSSMSELKDFGCEGVNEPDCFLPCVSLKWPDGFSPKGKKMMSGSVTSCYDCDESVPLTPQLTNSTKKIWRKKINPCSDGYRDACNYITPTIHLGVDCWPRASTPAGNNISQGLTQC